MLSPMSRRGSQPPPARTTKRRARTGASDRSPEDASPDLTGLLLAWSRGDEAALEELMPLVYADLRRMAARQLRHERSEHSLAPTALVHELYLRLIDQRRVTWQNRAQFFAIAARLMRRVLVDHARSRHARKRGGSMAVLSLDEAGELAAEQAILDVLVVDAALGRLAALDPDQARIVELRFFGGLTIEEMAPVLGRSTRTIKREWRLARAWLHRELRLREGAG
jgi:RNA polymerase sigma factor (TIGR02999 family)